MEDKYRTEVRSMATELAKKAAKAQRRLAQVDRFATGDLNMVQELTSLARDMELSIYVMLEGRRK